MFKNAICHTKECPPLFSNVEYYLWKKCTKLAFMHGVHNHGNLSGSHIGIVEDVYLPVRINENAIWDFVTMKLYFCHWKKDRTGANVPVECRTYPNPSLQEPWLYRQVRYETSAEVGLTCEDANDCHMIEQQESSFCNADYHQLLCRWLYVRDLFFCVGASYCRDFSSSSGVFFSLTSWTMCLLLPCHITVYASYALSSHQTCQHCCHQKDFLIHP